MTNTYMPPNEPRCRPSKLCSQAPRCVRFRAHAEPGRPLTDCTVAVYWIPGFCGQFKLLGHWSPPDAKPAGKEPHDYMKGLL